MVNFTANTNRKSCGSHLHGPVDVVLRHRGKDIDLAVGTTDFEKVFDQLGFWKEKCAKKCRLFVYRASERLVFFGDVF